MPNELLHATSRILQIFKSLDIGLLSGCKHVITIDERILLTIKIDIKLLLFLLNWIFQ